MIDNTEKIKAVKELLKVVQKNKDVFSCYIGCLTEYSLESEIERLEKEEEFGICLNPSGNQHYTMENSYDNWTSVTYFSQENGRKISWSDNGKQPKNEWLYVISFPTGPYIFGEEYPEETFRAFFGELKQFEPKYCDTSNKSLYFTGSRAKGVHEAFWHIFNKYKDEVEKELKKKRREHLVKELEKLKEEGC